MTFLHRSDKKFFAIADSPRGRVFLDVSGPLSPLKHNFVNVLYFGIGLLLMCIGIVTHAKREKTSFVISRALGHKPRGYRHLNALKAPVMSTKSSFPILASLATGNPYFVHRADVGATSLGTPIRTKMIIAVSVVILALLYAKGVTLMVDAANTPSAYATFLNRAD
jgi:hypothetical protein